MVEIANLVLSWPTLLLAVGIFGFAPGFCLRLIILLYPRDDERRSELIGELYAMPRIERPLWVGEQLEVGLFEGAPKRARKVFRIMQQQIRDKKYRYFFGRNRKSVKFRSVPDGTKYVVSGSTKRH
jgi:hypothetical protein